MCEKYYNVCFRCFSINWRSILRAMSVPSDSEVYGKRRNGLPYPRNNRQGHTDCHMAEYSVKYPKRIATGKEEEVCLGK